MWSRNLLLRGCRNVATALKIGAVSNIPQQETPRISKFLSERGTQAVTPTSFQYLQRRTLTEMADRQEVMPPPGSIIYIPIRRTEEAEKSADNEREIHEQVYIQRGRGFLGAKYAIEDALKEVFEENKIKDKPFAEQERNRSMILQKTREVLAGDIKLSCLPPDFNVRQAVEALKERNKYFAHDLLTGAGYKYELQYGKDTNGHASSISWDAQMKKARYARLGYVG